MAGSQFALFMSFVGPELASEFFALTQKSSSGKNPSQEACMLFVLKSKRRVRTTCTSMFSACSVQPVGCFLNCLIRNVMDRLDEGPVAT